MDPTQIPLPPSEAGSVRENEVGDTIISNADTRANLDLQSMNFPESASPPPESTKDDEYKKTIQRHLFLIDVAQNDPYIPHSDPLLREPTENIDDGKKPTRTESWERMLKEVRHDEDIVKGWRDDIDTLLVFAGLFSVVVTAFVIESYQWLDEDPADTTVTLLTHLISVQVNGSQTTSFEPTPFKPDALSIRINIFCPWARVIKRAQEVGGLPSDHFAPIPSFPTDSLPTLPKLDPIRYSIETSRDVQVDRDGVLDIVTSNKMGDTSGANLFPGGYTHHPYSFGPPINVNAPPESRGVGSSGNIIDHVSGMDGMGQPTDRQERFTADDDDNHMDEDNVLGKDDSTKDLGPSNRMDTGGILGDLSGQGDDLRDNGGDGFSRHR
ncbi:hypothetical protein Moror_2417 [Moniliophthora roreri MCA 2997]|uniref:DUF6535 domain-containing protein n=1 Tax=Moniliophthora roreri (strain MCA 2997) TaxID=1381753 RepID=V2Y2D7_MONRO|nr:hypothetical protein Moror_2417 [Moniliophthora roreri MCA 2997]